jgi:L-ascorbate metabolism protein UlaG (beta-lactamase superfamily)
MSQGHHDSTDQEVTMRLTKYGHACVRVERDGAVLVIDPGTFTEPEALDGADAVLITHEHPDHLDVDKLTGRPDLTVHTHPDVVAKLDGAGNAVQAVNAGDRFQAAGFDIQAYGGQHAVIHPDIPRIANLGYLIEGSVYHPGDSLDVPAGATIETLLVPVCAPWLKLAESVEFVRAVAPRRAYGIHDYLLSEAGGAVYDRGLAGLSGCDYARRAPGSIMETTS